MSSTVARNHYRFINRLNRKEDFRRVFSSKQRSADEQFLFIITTNNVGCARLGFAVSRRHIYKAVMRNRVKRVIRDSFRRNKRLLTGKDLFVLVRAPLLGLNQKKFDLILIKHLKKMGICNF